MAASWLRGVFPPIATAFDAQGALRPPPPEFFEYLREGGVDGVVALGSNGEAAQLTEAERLSGIGLVRDALPDGLHLIVGTGAESTVATIERTRSAAAAGAQAALVIAPSYYQRQLTAEALRTHFHAVAEASSIPVLIYNVPAHMGYDLGGEWIARLAGHPNIVGVKDSSGDLARLPQLRQGLGREFIILTGAGEQLLEALMAGADGAIAALANLAPAASAAIRRDFVAGKLEQARVEQRSIAALGQALTRGYGVPGLKAALQMLGYDHGLPRPPLPPLPAAELPALRRLLEDAGLSKRAIAS
jgi:4-hydroxy-2-oxoglutarate aldolase